jgi:hypothetical protein
MREKRKTLVKLFMPEDGKMLLEEARRQVAEMQKTVNQLKMDYGELKKKIESVSDTMLAISEAQKEHGEVTEEKAKNLIALYGALLTMNEKCGADRPEAVNNASYVAYAYLGGQAKREQIFVTEKA